MSATLEVECPNCGKPLKVPAELAGRKVKCKGCQEVFTVKAPKAAAAKPAGKAPPPAEAKPEEPKKDPFLDDEDDEPGTTPKPMTVVHESDVARCPHCAVELDPPTAVVCKNCGFNNRTRMKAETKKVWAPEAGDWIMHLGPGILAVLIIITLVVVDIVCGIKMKGWMEGGDLQEDTPDPVTGQKKFYVHPGAFIAIIVAFSLIVIIPSVKFAIRRLVYEWRPEEKLKK